jgi:hypothetical protein
LTHASTVNGPVILVLDLNSGAALSPGWGAIYPAIPEPVKAFGVLA